MTYVPLIKRPAQPVATRPAPVRRPTTAPRPVLRSRRIQAGVPDGLKLIAHELAHVVQQRQTGPVLLRKPRPGWIPPTRRQLRENRPTEDELVRAMHPANRSKQKGNTSLLQVAHEVTPNLLWQNQNPPQLPPGQTIPPHAVAWVLAKIVSTTENNAKGAQRPHIRVSSTKLRTQHGGALHHNARRMTLPRCALCQDRSLGCPLSRPPIQRGRGVGRSRVAAPWLRAAWRGRARGSTGVRGAWHGTSI